MITLGMQAVMFANVIIAVIVASVIVMLWYQTRNRYRGLSHLVIGCVLLAAGSLLIALRGTIPVWESVVLSNSMIIGGNLILFFGLSLFAGNKYNPILISMVLFLFAAFVATNIFFTFVQNDLTARVFNFTIGLFLTCSLGVWLMFRGVKPEIRRISTGTGISFVGISIILLVRLIAYCFMPQASNDFLQNGTSETLFVMLLDGAIAVLVFNFVSMVNKRLLLEFQDKENAATKNANELQAIFKFTSVGIVILVNRVCKEVNDACCEMLGYSREEIIGKDSHRLYAIEEEYRMVTQIYQEINKHSSSTTEIQFLRKDGKTINVIANIAALNKDDLSQGVIVSLVDITKHKQAEEARHESEEKYRMIVENTRDLIYTINSEGEYVYVSPSVKTMLGYNQTDLIGKSIISLVHPDDIPMIREEIWCNLHGHQTTEDREYRIRHALDEWRWIVSKGTRAVDTTGNFLYFIGVARDITEQKQAEEEKQRLEQKAEVTSRLAAMGEIAAGIAHEINNPLTGVLGFSEMMLENESLPEDIKDDIRLIADSSQRVANIVKRMLTFARQTKPVKTLTNLNDLIENTIKLREYVLRTNSIDVVIKFDPELPCSVVDAGQLQQVFLNLIVNAEQAMKEAHGKGTLCIRSEKFGNKIRISFRDDGPGISKENMSHLFEPFFTTKAAGEGTGLGLSISRSIVLGHDGILNVESKFGHGSTFIIELPIINVVPADIKTSTKKVQGQTSETMKSKILVVDDEPVVRNLVERKLKRMGHYVETFADARKAVEKIDSGVTYDLIFTDVRMPGMSGIELYFRILKDTPEMKNKFVFITGDVMGADIKTFLFKNNLPYLIKPFSIEMLTEQINSVLVNGQSNPAS